METKQRLNALRNVMDSVIEAVEANYYSKEDGLDLGDINYAEIRDWAGLPIEIDGQIIRNHMENNQIDRMIEDVCYLVKQQMF